MSEKKATPKNEAALNRDSENTTKKLFCPRQLKVLEHLVRRSATVRELFNIAGNNPPETVRQLRRSGVDVVMSWANGRDQDRRKIRYGVYHLPDESKQLARQMLGGD